MGNQWPYQDPDVLVQSLTIRSNVCSENGDNSPDSHCIQYFNQFLPTFPKLKLATPANGLIRHGGGLKPHGHSELVAGIDVMRRLIGEDIVRDDVLAE